MNSSFHLLEIFTRDNSTVIAARAIEVYPKCLFYTKHFRCWPGSFVLLMRRVYIYKVFRQDNLIGSYLFPGRRIKLPYFVLISRQLGQGTDYTVRPRFCYFLRLHSSSYKLYVPYLKSLLSRIYKGPDQR